MGTTDYTRRQFIRIAAAGAVGLSTLGGVAITSGLRPEARRPDRPNLLFIWTDEQRADTMAVYGNTKIHAPNLNRRADDTVGRCASVEHTLHSDSPRKQASVFTQGEVAGIAAAMAVEAKTTPRKLSVKELQAELLKKGVKTNQDAFKEGD